MTDPAAGRWEFPGGCLEEGETGRHAAVREWAEETGLALPPGAWAGEWVSDDGVYAGYVYEVASEDLLPILTGRDFTANPDDPDGDAVEALAWWDPDLLPNNPAVRAELLASMPLVTDTLGETAKRVTAAETALAVEAQKLVESALRVDAAREALIAKSAPQHVTVEAPRIDVHVPTPKVTVEAPHITVEAAPAPNVTVQAAPAPHITVQAPAVTVTPHIDVPAPHVDVHVPPSPAVRKVTRERDGSITVEARDAHDQTSRHDDVDQRTT